MTKKIKINVTARDIISGKRGQCSECPIAIAASRKLKTRMTVGVAGMQPMAFSWPTIKLETCAISFVREFDKGQDVKPFQFTIEIKDFKGFEKKREIFKLVIGA